MTLPSLEGRRVLVVEDEYMLVLDLEESLRAAGATVVGPVPSVAEAMTILDEEEALDAAVLDVNLGGEMAYPVADRLLALGVPFVFATGYGEADIPARLGHVPRCEKPVDLARVAQALAQAVGPT